MDENLTSAELDAEAQAIAEAQAGYDGKARAQAPAPEVAVTTAEPPLADPAQPESDEDADAEQDPPAEPAKPTAQEAVAAQLEDLKAQVRELASKNADGETVRKMHGEIGNINRTLKQLKALEKAEAPADDELAAALKNAEDVATEFPDLAGPLVKALKVLQSRMAAPAPEKDTQTEQEVDEDSDQVLTPEQRAAMQRDLEAKIAIKSLDEVHPDRHAIKETREFKEWFAAKPPEYQSKVKTSWNAAVVAQCFTDFKATVAARKRKQERLEAAATPQGMPRSTPSTISDEEAARRGYERARAKRL